MQIQNTEKQINFLFQYLSLSSIHINKLIVKYIKESINGYFNYTQDSLKEFITLGVRGSFQKLGGGGGGRGFPSSV